MQATTVYIPPYYMDFRLPIFATLLAVTTLPATTIIWNVDASGNWEDTANWDTGTVPNNADDVTINQPSNILVTINSAAKVNTLIADNDVSIASNGLTVFGFATFNQGFTLGNLNSINANGGSIDFQGATNFDGGNILVSNVGYLSAPNLTSYVAYDGFVANKLEANGVESSLNLSALTTMTGNTAPSAVTQVNAKNGALVDLSSLTTVTNGKVAFTADGDGSSISLTSFQSLNHTGNVTSSLNARNGGSIYLPSSGVSLTTTDIYLDDLSFLDVAAIQNYNGGTATIDGAVVSFTDLTNADGTGFVALNGAVIDLTTLTDYNGSTAAVATEFTADGTGSTIYMDQVTTLTGNTFASTRTYFQATNEGLIDLHSLQTIDGGGTDFYADGTGSLIDLSSLTSITNTVNIGGVMEATNGGEILFGQTGITAEKISLLLDGTGIFDHSAFSEWRNGTISVDGSNESFDSLTNINGSSILAASGAIVSFNNITSYNANTGFVNTNIAADSASIDLSNVTIMTGSVAASTRTNIFASNGGLVKLNSLATINPSTTAISADGTGSIVEVNSLTSMTHSGNTSSFISATNNGYIDFGDSSPTLSNVSIFLDTGGVIATTGSIIMNGGIFAGNGLLGSNLALNNGTLSPGNSAGTLGTNGDLDIGAGTVYAWELAVLADDSNGTEGIDWDLVTGKNIQFISGSSVMLGFLDVLDPDSGDAFWNLSHSWVIAEAENSLLDSGLSIFNPDFLQGSFSLASSSDQLFLNFAPVPEPSTYLLFALGGGLVGLWFWRRRSAS